MTINCALDGPGGAGKSTIAKAVAKSLGYVYVDTGALYRSIGLYCTRNGIDPGNASEVELVLGDISVELCYDNGEQKVVLNGEDVSKLIRTNEISMAASAVSAIPKVREFLLDLQRDIAAKNNIIMDGRDIGTVILPNAQVKIFMTASAEVRASRRHKELLEKGQDISYEKVLEDINQRDYNDSHRATAPLKQAEDAVLLDTSEMNIEQAVEEVVRIIEKKTADAGKPALKPAKKTVTPARKGSVFYALLRAVVGFGLGIVFSFKVEGRENIPVDRAVIVAPNHITWADPVFVSVPIRTPSAYMAKESLLENKLLAPLIKLFHAFPVKRDQSDRTALKTSVDYLNQGYNLTIFPEGTRSKDGKLGRGKSGVAFIASESGADVLPAGIVFEKRKGKRTRLTIRYGKVIPNEKLTLSSLNAAELRRSRDVIMNEIGALCTHE